MEKQDYISKPIDKLDKSQMALRAFRKAKKMKTAAMKTVFCGMVVICLILWLGQSFG